jgi:hypothetical protein
MLENSFCNKSAYSIIQKNSKNLVFQKKAFKRAKEYLLTCEMRACELKI